MCLAYQKTNIIDPLPFSQGYQYCLMTLERFSQWPGAVAIADITAEKGAQALLLACIARFGCPSTISESVFIVFLIYLYCQLAVLRGFQCVNLRKKAYRLSRSMD